MKRLASFVITAAMLGALAAGGAALAAPHGDVAGVHAAAGHDAHAAAGHGAHAVGHAPDINWFTFYPSDGKGPPLAIALLNFAVLVFILVKLFGAPLSSFLRQRHEGIKQALEEGARLRDEAQRKLDEYGRKIASVDKEVDDLVASIRAAAEQEKARILERAEQQAAALEREARERIDAEVARARRALEREVVSAAISAAEQLVRERARDDDHRRLADAFIGEIVKTAGAHAGSGATVDDQW